MKLSKDYLINNYKQEILEFKCACNEDEQWQARQAMAKIENIAMTMYGFDFADELHQLLIK